MLAKVVRPDGKTVEFGYDALGRRVWKKYGAKTTKWIWDGNVPVHEWVEVDPSVAEAQGPALIEAKDAGLRQRAIDLANISPQGPPPSGLPSVADDPITWVFEPESFAPLAKLTATGRYGIVTDHLGTPTAMLDEQGQTAWSADISVFGELRNVVGEKSACPFRWPGQYEDEETGLYYNRFRYYDPEAGTYVSQDPIGLRGGLQLHGYVRDPLRAFDGLGLSPSCVPPEAEPEAISRKNAFRLLRSRGLSEKEARNIVNSFEGQIYMSKGKKGDVFVITGTAPGSASGVFVTRDFAGDTPSERVRNLALPTSNTAEHQGLVELTRSQTLLEGRVAPQPSWGAARTAGGWQTVTDGGRYTGATSEIL
jgi:RHS repeat-associated protein